MPYFVSVENISKKFKMYSKPWDRPLEWVSFGKKRMHREFWALKDISFKLKKGECLGLIGPNGAGKSTLLKILTGTIHPTKGVFYIQGRLLSLLELGMGFNPELTGRQNLYNSSKLLGLPQTYIKTRIFDIEKFAELGDFFDRPIKIYSSGMYVRLAFSMFVFLEPDVLLIDETFSVGDIFFQQKCHSRIETLLNHGTACILVSHDMTTIEKHTHQSLLLDQGKCIFHGSPNEAVEHYYRKKNSFEPNRTSPLADRKREPDVDIKKIQFNPIHDWPDEEVFSDLDQAVIIGEKNVARCNGIALCNKQGNACNTFEIGDTAYFYYEFELFQNIQVPSGGIVLTNKLNVNVHGKNSLQYMVKAPPLTKKGTRVRFRQTVELSLAPGEYTFVVGLATIRHEDYVRINQIDYNELENKIKTILRVRQAGRLLIIQKTQGQRLPFHGYTDLSGTCVLSLL